MRRKDEQQLDVFSNIPQRTQRMVLRNSLFGADMPMTDEALSDLQPRFKQAVRKNRAALDCAGEVVAKQQSCRASPGPYLKDQGSHESFTGASHRSCCRRQSDR